MSDEDNNVVPLVIEASEVCQVCGRQRPICAELDMHIRYRELPGELFRAVVRICPVCADMLHLDPDKAKSTAPALAPVPDGEMCACGQPAVILTAQGKKCADCAFS